MTKASTQYFHNLLDPEWYLENYPDVADSGIDPLFHYIEHGRDEGRLPYQLKALYWEPLLWDENDTTAYKHLVNIHKNENINSMEKCHAAWILAQWHSSYGRWKEILQYINYLLSTSYGQEFFSHLGPVLLKINALTHLNKIADAKKFTADEINTRGEEPNLLLAMSSFDKGSEGLNWINKLFSSNHLHEIRLLDENLEKDLDNLCENKSYTHYYNYKILNKLLNKLRPLVTVIMPVFNAEKEITTAVRSLLEQTWKNIEIIIVNDASSDDTATILGNLKKKDSRITLIHNDYNQGSYPSRNKGLKASKGEFITVHDSDDWSHPQKIELQVKALLNNEDKIASMSHMVRCTNQLNFYHWHIRDSWIYLNMSSLMFRREAVEKLGYWDRVKVGADSEFHRRISNVYGENAIYTVKPGIPLSFTRIDEHSLSNSSSTHLRTLFFGARKDYKEAVEKWHTSCDSKEAFYLSDNPDHRPFPIPKEFRVTPHEDTVKKHYLSIQKSGLFNHDWYLSHSPDVANFGDDPLTHYLRHGGYEGKDPGPDFSSSGYSHLYLDDYPQIINPLAHYLSIGIQEEKQALPLLHGLRQKVIKKKNILVCAHASGKQVFGSERRLLDILDGLNTVSLNIIVSIPEISNQAYLKELLKRCCYVKVIPYSWWHKGGNHCQETINHFNELIVDLDINIVYSDTMTIWEPLLAAKAHNIPNYSHIHIRELPEQDPDLCKILDAEPIQIKSHVLGLADNIIAYSKEEFYLYLFIQKSGLFNHDWYLSHFPDVANSGSDPLMHYIRYGSYEERDPGPDFSSSGYSHLYLEDYPEIINPLAHYLSIGIQEEKQALPLLHGLQQKVIKKKNILVCAHASGKQIFGAERSLLDILDGLNKVGLNIIVSIPEILNQAYLEELLKRCCYVKVIPYSWWRKGSNHCQETLNHFNELIVDLDINIVYADTITIWEPLLAARANKIPNYIHIRELPEHDPDLCNILNAEPVQIKSHVLGLADNIIANSDVVARSFEMPGKTHVVHNLIDVELYDLENTIEDDQTVIAMISSNLPKKGIEDFFSMSQRLSVFDSNIHCVLVGPENEDINKLQNSHHPGNLEITGYLTSPQEAISKANIIVSLSHFQESFGRTILEAMAARRCVIGYNWGALPELIRDGENGYIVPYRDIQVLVDKVLYLHNHPDLIIKMGRKGRKIAEEHYNFNQFTSQLKSALNPLI